MVSSLVLALLAIGCVGQNVAFLTQPMTISAFQCGRNNNSAYFQKVVVTVLLPTGEVDANACSTLLAARQTGISLADLLVSPSTSSPVSPRTQYQRAIDSLSSCGALDLVRQVWLDFTNTSAWPSVSMSQLLFQELADGCLSYNTDRTGIKCGVFTSKESWEMIFGTDYTFGAHVGLDLLLLQLDNSTTNYFVAFGGWSKPLAKQYAQQVSVCNFVVHLGIYFGKWCGLYNYYNLASDACDSCQECLTCTSSRCLLPKCNAGMFFNMNLRQCVPYSVCPAGTGRIFPTTYFQDVTCSPCVDQTFSDQGYCVSCSSCPQGSYESNSCSAFHNVECSKCDTECIACEASNSDCYGCLSGYVNSPAGTCSPCSSGCYQCSSPTNCQGCAEGWYLNGAACAPCPANCVFCSPQQGCLGRCNNGFFLIGSGCDGTCLPECRTCESATQCSSCFDGTYLNEFSRCVPCTSLFPGCAKCTASTCLAYRCFPGPCPRNYYTLGHSCVRCNSVRRPGFAMIGTCEGNHDVSYVSCILGQTYQSASSYSVPGSCASCSICDSGFYLAKECTLVADTVCLPCPQHCTSCDTNAQCNVCEIGYELTGNACVSCMPCTDCSCISCVAGYFMDGSQCEPCPQNCARCVRASHSVCVNQTCHLEYYMSCLECVSHYPRAFLVPDLHDPGMWCQQCAINCCGGSSWGSDCTATSDRTCVACGPNMWSANCDWRDNKEGPLASVCNACTSCPWGVLSGQCTSVSDNTVCAPCSDPSCCADGTSWDGTRCSACLLPGVSHCTDPPFGLATSCYPDYFLMDGGCISLYLLKLCCPTGSFWNATTRACQACKQCPPSQILSACSSSADTVCECPSSRPSRIVLTPGTLFERPEISLAADPMDFFDSQGWKRRIKVIKTKGSKIPYGVSMRINVEVKKWVSLDITCSYCDGTEETQTREIPVSKTVPVYIAYRGLKGLAMLVLHAVPLANLIVTGIELYNLIEPIVVALNDVEEIKQKLIRDITCVRGGTPQGRRLLETNLTLETLNETLLVLDPSNDTLEVNTTFPNTDSECVTGIGSEKRCLCFGEDALSTCAELSLIDDSFFEDGFSGEGWNESLCQPQVCGGTIVDSSQGITATFTLNASYDSFSDASARAFLSAVLLTGVDNQTFVVSIENHLGYVTVSVYSPQLEDSSVFTQFLGDVSSPVTQVSVLQGYHGASQISGPTNVWTRSPSSSSNTLTHLPSLAPNPSPTRGPSARPSAQARKSPAPSQEPVVNTGLQLLPTAYGLSLLAWFV